MSDSGRIWGEGREEQLYDSPTYGDLQSPAASKLKQQIHDATNRVRVSDPYPDRVLAPIPGLGFTVKDSGARQEFASGMVRDTSEGKVDYTRLLDGPMLKRWAEHLTRAEKKYPDIAPGVANWTLGDGPEELQRARKSAFRHMVQWLLGDVDEDHASAVYFNINLAENVKLKMGGK